MCYVNSFLIPLLNPKFFEVSVTCSHIKQLQLQKKVEHEVEDYMGGKMGVKI